MMNSMSNNKRDKCGVEKCELNVVPWSFVIVSVRIINIFFMIIRIMIMYKTYNKWYTIELSDINVFLNVM